MQTQRILTAIAALKAGQFVILTDHPDRENEGDLIIAAEHLTDAKMNFIIRNSSGIVCISLDDNNIDRFRLTPMVATHENTSSRSTPFTVSIDAKHGISTGVSAADRVKTIQTLLSDTATHHDLVKPGHVFPLHAQPGGVLARQGHTEGALDLVKLAGLKAVAVLCEVMTPDGNMARGKELLEFANQYAIPMLSIDEIISHRLQHESIIAEQVTTSLPLTDYGDHFQLTLIKEKYSALEHVVLYNPVLSDEKAPLIRIHSSCMTGDLFASRRCDCHHQLHHSLERISQEGGFIIYLNQEGRGIGLFNKIKAYALQEQGFDTVEANQALGLPIDARQYHIAAHILKKLNIDSVRLLTANPNKVSDLKKYGISNVTIEAMPMFINACNQKYLETKQAKIHNQVRN